jgi:hypothetical protein
VLGALLDQDPLQPVILGGTDPPSIADAKIRLEAAAPVTHQPVELPAHAIELSRFGQIKLTTATGINGRAPSPHRRSC